MNQDLEKNTAPIEDGIKVPEQVPEQVLEQVPEQVPEQVSEQAPADSISNEEVLEEPAVDNVLPQNETVNLEKPSKKKKWLLFGVIAGAAALIAVICYFLLFSMPTMKDVDKAFKDGDYKKALKMLGKMTEEGDTAAFTRLYNYYVKHDDPEEAWKWLNIAAGKDVPSAMYQLGKQYEKKEKTDSAKFWLAKAAKLEVPQYMFDYADLCRKTHDTTNFVKWMEKAAAGSDKAIAAQACSTLGMHYFDNPTKAMPYLEKGATMDDGVAQWGLASLYQKSGNIEKSQYWLSRCVDNTTAPMRTREQAFKGLLKHYEETGNTQGKEDLLKRAVGYEIPDASRLLMLLGTSYFLGNNGVSKDETKGVQLVKIAAQKGMPAAEYAYGMMIADDDFEEGYRWVEKAAQQGYSKAVDILTEWSVVYYSDVQGKTWKNINDATGVSRTVQFLSGGIVRQRWVKPGDPDSEIVFKVKKTRYKGQEFFVIDDILDWSGSYDPRDYIGQPFALERTLEAKINILATDELTNLLNGTYEKVD